MRTTAIVLLEIALADPKEEDVFFGWWAEAKKLLSERVKTTRLDLLISDRGRYTVSLEAQFPGGFKLVAKDRPWQELDSRRPRGTLTVRELRVWHDGEGTRDITMTTLRAWLADRAAGRRDFVLVDALPPESFAAKRIPGSVNLPKAAADAERAASVIGSKDQTVVIYCADYG